MVRKYVAELKVYKKGLVQDISIYWYPMQPMHRKSSNRLRIDLGNLQTLASMHATLPQTHIKLHLKINEFLNNIHIRYIGIFIFELHGYMRSSYHSFLSFTSFAIANMFHACSRVYAETKPMNIYIHICISIYYLALDLVCIKISNECNAEYI